MITELLGNYNYVLYSPICNFPPYHQYTDNMNQNMFPHHHYQLENLVKMLRFDLSKQIKA